MQSRRTIHSLLALSLCYPASNSYAQSSGAAVLNRYAEAIGGSAVLAVSSIRSSGTVELAPMGISGILTSINAGENRIAVIMELQGVGTVTQVFDGTHGWAMDQMQGPRLLTGAELDRLRDDAGIPAVLRRGGSLVSSVIMGDTAIAGSTCTWVRLTYKSGRDSSECYDVATGLMTASRSTQESAMGVVVVTSTMTDWKAFGALKSATRIVGSMPGMQQRMTVEKIEFNRPDDAAIFDMPAAIKALLPKR